MPDDTAALEQLVELSRWFGNTPGWIVAGGGNTSYKTPNTLYVKASGFALADITPNGFVALDRRKLDAMLVNDWPAEEAAREAAFKDAVMAARRDPDDARRPSVEALLHHLVDAPFVVHTHPTVVNALASTTRAVSLAADLAPSLTVMPYVDPGLILSLELARFRTAGDPLTDVLLLNHGLVLARETPDAIIADSTQLADTLTQAINAAPLLPPLPEPNPAALQTWADAWQSLAPDNAAAHTTTDTSAAVRWVATTAEGCAAIAAGPLNPDQIVYARSLPILIEPDSARSPVDQLAAAEAAYTDAHGFEPWAAVIADLGLVTRRDSPALAATTRDILVDAAAIYRDAHRLGGVTVLDQAQRGFIERWEVEAYRRSIVAG
ncbi:MAG: class II aldolase/adducin family protein [Planctomycetota bacterium]